MYTVGETQSLADDVKSANAGGMMLWSIQKGGAAAQPFATAICNKLGLGNCSKPML